MVNKVTLIGNLGRDPEIRKLESGSTVAKLAVATSESYRDATGNWQDRTEWHNVICWNALAEKAERSFKKGSLVYIEGKLTTRKWQDNNGNDRWTTEVLANYTRIINNRSEGGGGGYANSFPAQEPAGMQNNTAAQTSNPTPASPAAPVADTSGNDDGGDLPF